MQSTASTLAAGFLLLSTIAAGQALHPPMDPDAAVPLTPVEDVLASDPQKIVNGLITSGLPTVGMLDTGSGTCSGTLIGCQTFLTAAHCVVGNLDPSAYTVFFQHNGIYAVTSIAVHPLYAGPGGGHDVAVLRLEQPTTGVAPGRINTIARPPFNTRALIGGFGRPGDLPAAAGIKRFGEVRTASCSIVSNAEHVCWSFTLPRGLPGLDASTCPGDSGGPLFVGSTAGDLVAGVTSGGNPASCLEPNFPWDSDVFVDRQWIQQAAGTDINASSCPPLPAAGSANAPILGGFGSLSANNLEDTFTLTVPAGTSLLGFTLNGDGGNDFDLFASAGSTVDPDTAFCQAESQKNYEACFIQNPTPGTWAVQASRFSGAGLYQVTATLFLSGSQPSSCTPSATTLCIDDQPGDKRFAAEVAWNRAGALGQAGAIALSSVGVTQGGLFGIGGQSNPEVLLKVLNGCGVNGHFWVFYSAGTNQGLDVTVRDTQTGQVWTSTNQNGTLAPPVADVAAFACN